jgi:hypothetical protein
MTMHHLSPALLGAFSLTGALTAAPSTEGSRAWEEGNVVSVETRSPATGEKSSFSFEITQTSDVRLELSWTEDGAQKHGSVMVISGTTLAKDVALTPSREAYVRAVPWGTLAVLNTLLAHAAHGAPSDVHGRVAVNVFEPNTPLHIRGWDAVRDFAAPWSLRGFIESKQPGVVEFDLTSSFPRPEGGTGGLQYTGRWEQRADVRAIDDELSLAGWQVVRSASPRRGSKDDTTESLYQTAGDVRRAPAKNSRDPRETMEERRKSTLAEDEKALAAAKTDEDRFVVATRACHDAAAVGDFEKAVRYGDEALKLAETFKSSWNYGNAIHHVHLARGHAALARDDVSTAIAELHAAGATPGSPQLDSFGPNMALAKALLARGKRDAVLSYLDQCGEFWKDDYGALGKWRAAIEKGEPPDFGANLAY